MAMVADKPAVRGPVPGAGVDPRKVIRPSKRLRNWHRKWGKAQNLTLRQFAHTLADARNGGDSEVAKRWLAQKGARP